MTLAEARPVAKGVKVNIQGQVTSSPGVFGERIIYMQGAAARIMIHLSSGDYPVLAKGDWARARGQIWDYHSEREIGLRAPGGIQHLRQGQPLVPLPIATGEVGEAREGLLVQATGNVVGYGRDPIRPDDGS